MTKKIVQHNWLADSRFFYHILATGVHYKDWKEKDHYDGVEVALFQHYKGDMKSKQPVKTVVYPAARLKAMSTRMAYEQKLLREKKLLQRIHGVENLLGAKQGTGELFVAQLQKGNPSVQFKLTETQFEKLCEILEV